MIIKTYVYKEKTYTSLHSLSEALGNEGIFIPLSISDEDLAALDVTVNEEEEPLDIIKARKVSMLKSQRDNAEVEPIVYNENTYDYDDKARERINAAIIALDVQSNLAKSTASIDWTTADNKDVKVTADDLRMVIASVAQRSNVLHVAYRIAKEKVENASTKEEVEAVFLDLNLQK